MVSFLHTADLHLGLRITRFNASTTKRIREARFQAVEKIRAAAVEHKVDFLLIAGDLFDDHAVDGDIARRTFDLLQSFPVPVYVLSGNHDPLLAGSVWDRSPWISANNQSLVAFREAKPVEALPGVVLYPCPVYRKTSLTDPTLWMTQLPEDRGPIRIGIAHGSLKTRDDLPADDHLIARHAAHALGLDYLALGHWHRRQCFAGPDGVERTAYCGVHEPMRFPESSENRTGWVPYSAGTRDEFLDAGKGEILLVSIAGPGAPPEIRALEVGHLSWEEQSRTLATSADLAELINEVAVRPATERRLLRLRLSGTLDAETMLRLRQLREVLDRYLFADLDHSELHIQPTEQEINIAAADGVLRRVLARLREEAAGSEPDARRVAERAMALLYEIAEDIRA
jgi:DNA repair exonuclease SbcCD nuclease subunit